MRLPERLKSSRRLQLEVAIAGYALWQLKKEINKRRDAIEPPVSEHTEDTTVFVWPDSFDENHNPKGVEVGSISPEGVYTRVFGAINRSREFTGLSSESSRKGLINLKKQVMHARQAIIDRNAISKDPDSEQ